MINANSKFRAKIAELDSEASDIVSNAPLRQL